MELQRTLEVCTMVLAAAVLCADYGDGGMTVDGAVRKAGALLREAVKEHKTVVEG